MKLSEVKKGEQIEIVSVELAEDQCLRLREIGITEHFPLKLAQKGAFGARVISRGSERIAVDARCAKCIEVRVITSDSNGKYDEASATTSEQVFEAQSTDKGVKL